MGNNADKQNLKLFIPFELLFLPDKINELTSKAEDLQSGLQSQRRFGEQAEIRHQGLLEAKEKELQMVIAGQDVIQAEKDQLQQVFNEQEK